MFRLRSFFLRLLYPEAPTMGYLKTARYPLAVLGAFTCVAILLTYPSLQASSGLRLLPYQSNATQSTEPLSLHCQPPSADANSSDLKHTTIPSGAHVHGFTVLDNIYLRNGTFYVVTMDRSTFPPRNRMLSRPIKLGSKDMEPTDEHLQFISPEEVTDFLGTSITHIEGFSVIVYDPAEFMKHFYHWFGEIILGFWRVYSHILLDPHRAPTALPLPRRFILPFIHNEEWRDKAGVDGPLMRAAFPAAAIEESGYWKDLAKLGTTVVFERIILVNRDRAHKHPFGGVWYKMIAGAMNVSAPPDFWAPVRTSLWRNTLGAVPVAENTIHRPPLVTYISRQGGGRRLVAEDHDALVAALRALEADGVCEFQLAAMERIPMREQIELVSRSTILVGVHGNGLTHQLWMPPSPLSATIEILVPKGYAFDYEMLARNMGHRHYAVWNDTFLTYGSGTYHKGVSYPDGFHGIIPVHGPTVAGIVRDRLSQFVPVG
ncbi:hypothetical protein C8F04DRAFT_1079244 [Mycena alexandri]|uniref:Glycosyltransferase 61 catalytic domain-containing protein n=1 Tax=Mycena alexandri TaxID=1745969 RepID=A0AAD6TAN6_9AGAR|nr:hypothetical protein C8F04DRAFT_1079244 [Mycena alexandri]